VADTFLFTNNAVSTLASGINDTDGTLFLNPGDGAKFPSPAAGQRFAATLMDAAGNIEIVYCSARSTDTLTITRNEESSGAKSWLAGDTISLRITAGILNQILQGDGQVIALTNADQVDGIDASTTAEANKLLALDASSILQAVAADALLLSGQNAAYYLARGNHTGTMTAADVSGLHGRQIFFADGDFTVPETNTIYVAGLSGYGGGGGGGGFGDNDGGFGGGSGTVNNTSLLGLAITELSVTPGEIIPFTVGAGGTGGAGATVRYQDGYPGADGGDTVFDGPVRDASLGELVVNKYYKIKVVGTTDWVSLGASSNAVGVIFQTTGVGSGTGTATEVVKFSGAGTGGLGGISPSNAESSSWGGGHAGADGISGDYGIGGAGGAPGSAGGGNGSPGEDANLNIPGSYGGSGGGGGGCGYSTSADGGAGGDSAEGILIIYW
jgi:hypothetical protein